MTTEQGTVMQPVSVSTRSRWTTGAYFAFFACYLGGLLLWLLLGLVPSVAFAVPTLTRELNSLADGGGPFSGAANAIVMNQTMVSSGGLVAIEYLFSLLNLTLGVLITWRRPYGVVPRLLALGFIGTAATFNMPSHVVFHLLENAPVVTAVHFMFHVVSGVAYLWAVLLFPEGKLPFPVAARFRWVSWLGGAAITALITWTCYRSSFIAHPPFFVAFFGILVPVVGIIAQTLRLRQPTLTATSRQQARLLRTALVPAFVAALLWLGAHAVESVGGSRSPSASAFADGVQEAFPAVFAVVPVMLFVAILRYRLWDIDLAVSRTVVYALLAGVVIVVYAAALAATGWLFEDDIWSTLAAMMVVALVAEPIRQWAGRLANRMVFGTVLTPRESMRVLAERLTSSTSTNELAELARLVVAGTRCRAAQVWLVVGDQLVLAAAAPEAASTPSTVPIREESLAACSAALPDWSCIPVTHEGQLLAVLASTLPARVAMPSSETALLRDLAGHAGLLVANARLATELAQEVDRVTDRASELLRSRQLVVAAQDGERRQLERDIHDGAQQDLVALLIQIRAYARTGSSAAEPAGAASVNLRPMVDTARRTVDQLCRGGRPDVLEVGGLSAALDAAATPVRGSGVRVEVLCDLSDRPPVDVESAIYFCCLEALQNSVKHAHASRIVVEVRESDEGLALLVCDDGLGFDPARAAHGSGTRNLLERMAVVGGTVTVESAPSRGTTLIFQVPSQQPSVVVRRQGALV